MIHACFVLTILCLVYTLRHFYTFSGTNLLTRCCSDSCLFSAVFGFRKASKEIFSELDGTKAEVNILSEQRRSPEGIRSGATRRPHLGLSRVHPRACRPMVWAPRAPLRLAFFLLKHPNAETLSTRSKLHETVCSRRHHRT